MTFNITICLENAVLDIWNVTDSILSKEGKGRGIQQKRGKKEKRQEEESRRTKETIKTLPIH